LPEQEPQVSSQVRGLRHFYGSDGCYTIGNRTDGKTEENTESTADAAETAVGDGPIVRWGSDYCGEGVGDKKGPGADENAISCNCPENLTSDMYLKSLIKLGEAEGLIKRPTNVRREGW
jgi:hypothetical protein